MSKRKELPSAQIYRLRLTLVGVSFALASVVLSVFVDWLEDTMQVNQLLLASLHWIAELLLVAGAFGLVTDFFAGRARDKANRAIYREEQEEMIPTYVDSVLEAFSASPEKLERVASPKLLDDLASNALSLRLGDDQFARELYEDIRDQAIRSAERWYDVEVRIRLSGIPERSTSGTPRFDVTVEWEYTTIPSSKVRRFMCVSDRSEYNEVRDDAPATQAWFMTPRPGMDASSRESYELLEFSVDGQPLKIRRSARKSGQTYSVDLGGRRDGGEPVRLRQVFRTVTPMWGHRLYFELRQPSRGVSLSLDYTNTSIANMHVSDTVSTNRPIRLTRTPPGGAGKEVGVDATGWLMPKTGFAFTWTLESELPRDAEAREAA
ncbi:hypothetical protein [Brevibacterium sp.]|uniref:hypothetical protein n=1 Tax=Brevibacterium sp. TaxID=1701 RepID=UPI0028123CC0|nr:hypothetical protein [Brevibacterium sp.]